MKVLIAVTHLLGTGHLSRALTLGRAFAARGHTVTVVSGGMPVPQLDASAVALVQLPPLRSDGIDFSRLLEDSGSEADDTYRSARLDRLIATLHDTAPDVLITELFPFGRRNLTAEFITLLEAARDLPKRPVVLSSIRDILAPPSKPAKAERAEAIICDLYDGVLVHSDPRVTTLDRSWPVSPRLARLLHYTGYVAPPAPRPHPDGAGRGAVLVSAGGGGVGADLFRAALRAAERTPDLHWHLLVGGPDAPARVRDLSARVTSDNLTLEPARSDFRQMLTHAAASVSMCGYNTALDLLQAGTPAVLIPFDAGGEVEQGLRAEAMSALPAVQVLNSDRIDAETLANAVQAVRAAGPRQTLDLQFDGADRSVAIAESMLQEHA